MSCYTVLVSLFFANFQMSRSDSLFFPLSHVHTSTRRLWHVVNVWRWLAWPSEAAWPRSLTTGWECFARSLKHQHAAWNLPRVSLIKHPTGSHDCQHASAPPTLRSGRLLTGGGGLNLFHFFSFFLPPPHFRGDDNKDNCLTRAGRTGGKLGARGMPTSRSLFVWRREINWREEGEKKKGESWAWKEKKRSRANFRHVAKRKRERAKSKSVKRRLRIKTVI